MTWFRWLPVAAFVMGASGCRAEQTWNGKISDQHCGAVHDWDEHAPPMTERECTLQCIRTGSTYVFVSDNQVHPIENQDHPALTEHAGHMVRLTGRMQDNAITISRLDAP